MHPTKLQQRLWAALTAAFLGLSFAFVGACGFTDAGTVELLDDRQGMSILSFTDLGSAMGSPVISGQLVGAANEFEPTLACVGNTSGLGGSDLSYRWTAPSASSYTFTTAGSGVIGFTDTVVHIYNFATGSLLGCNDNADPTTLNSSLTLNLAAGEQIRIVVDAWGQGVHNDFKLNISFTCPTAPSDCFVAPGTWDGNACIFAPKSAGVSCNDGNACTTGDVCNGGGICGGNSIVCNTPPGQCFQSAGTCSNGTCSYAPKASGSTCNDGNACTVGDVCNGSGSCGGAPKACNTPPGQCYQAPGTCSNGTCSYSPRPAGSDCYVNDCWSSACNGAGSCSNTGWLCEVGEICRFGTCMPKY